MSPPSTPWRTLWRTTSFFNFLNFVLLKVPYYESHSFVRFRAVSGSRLHSALQALDIIQQIDERPVHALAGSYHVSCIVHAVRAVASLGSGL